MIDTPLRALNGPLAGHVLTNFGIFILFYTGFEASGSPICSSLHLDPTYETNTMTRTSPCPWSQLSLPEHGRQQADSKLSDTPSCLLLRNMLFPLPVTDLHEDTGSRLQITGATIPFDPNVIVVMRQRFGKSFRGKSSCNQYYR